MRDTERAKAALKAAKMANPSLKILSDVSFHSGKLADAIGSIEPIMQELIEELRENNMHLNK